MQNETLHEKIVFDVVRFSFLLMGIGVVVIFLRLFSILPCSWLTALTPIGIAYVIFAIALTSLAISDKINQRKSKHN
jgi:hypothetical protein